jgi:hypothetical protein
MKQELTGRRPKIDPVVLERMLKEGKPSRYCAEFFGVTPAAISKAKKRLDIQCKKRVARTVTTEAAPVVVTQRLNAIEQLQKINTDANELLDLCMRWQRGDSEALRILESQVRYIKVGSGEEAEEVRQFKFKDPRELALKAMAEIRNQLGLQLEIFKTLYDAEAVREFQNELIELLGEVDPELRNRFIEKLREKGIVRSILESAVPTPVS